MKKILNELLSPAVLIKRYWTSKQEIKKLKKVDSSLRDNQIANLVSLTDRLTLLEHLPSNATVAEIGVASGDFSQRILETCKPKELHLVDYWSANKSASGIDPSSLLRVFRTKKTTDWERVNDRFETQINNGQVVLQRGFSWEMLEKFDDSFFDWVYIDAGHDYESVRKDLEAAESKIKDGGIIAGHDYVRWGRFGFKCGVVEAVNEFCINRGYEIIYLTLETKTNASFAIKKTR